MVISTVPKFEIRKAKLAIPALIQLSEDDESDRWLRGWTIEVIEKIKFE